jgi:hypothetical protein
MNKAIIFIFGFIVANIALGKAQSTAWSTLGMVTTSTTFDPDYGMEIKKVKISPIVRSLEGKEIEVDGYIIPLKGKLAQNHFMLSKFTNNMCFFCGKAGPETAMQVFLANDKKAAYTDDKIKVKGILRINENDPGGLLYTLDNAVLIN